MAPDAGCSEIVVAEIHRATRIAQPRASQPHSGQDHVRHPLDWPDRRDLDMGRAAHLLEELLDLMGILRLPLPAFIEVFDRGLVPNHGETVRLEPGAAWDGAT